MTPGSGLCFPTKVENSRWKNQSTFGQKSAERIMRTLSARMYRRARGLTAVKPGIYGLAFTMVKWFSTDNSATVGRILMISSADPHGILILIKC